MEQISAPRGNAQTDDEHSFHFFFFQAEDGIRDSSVTGVQTCALPIYHSKAQQAHSLGFDEVIDLSVEELSDGVRRITEGYGADIVIDAMGGEILSEALGTLSIEIGRASCRERV